MYDKNDSDGRSSKREGGRDGGRDGGAPMQSPPAIKAIKLNAAGKPYLDYKETETLRKLTAANGKMLGRKRNGASALEQRIIAQAIKRARFMALIPYTTAAQ